MSTEEEAAPVTRSTPRERARRRLSAADERFYRGTWIQDFVGHLKSVDVFNATTLFGSALLLSTLPLIIILSSIAEERIDDDVSRHIGLNAEGAGIVAKLFRHTPATDPGPIILAAVLGIAGTMAAIGFLAEIYERVFQVEHRGWRDWWRFALWTVAALVFIAIDSIGASEVGDDFPPLIRIPVTAVVLAVFFAWTMRFLLANQVPWDRVIRPGIVTSVMWVIFAIASSFLFSSTLVSDSKLYGKIGV